MLVASCKRFTCYLQEQLTTMPYLLQIDWQTFLLGNEDWSFLMETILRSFIMFVVITGGLRMLGKRSITQLSVYELGVIIGLGSAAGDPMFYKDVGLLVGLCVFVVVLGLYKFITFLINKSDKVELIMEGKPTLIIDQGQLKIDAFEKEPIAHEELFSMLRMNSVSHLGQVKHAIIETNGHVSIFYYADDDVKFGLPILPHLCENQLAGLPQDAHYSCTYCGHTKKLAPSSGQQCAVCGRKEWLMSIDDKRIR